jgi:hypothetical protein
MRKLLMIVCLGAWLLLIGTLHSEVIQIGNGSLINQCLPIEPLMKYSYSQSIYLSSEIGFSGLITSVAFKYSIASATFLNNTNQLSIYLGNVSRTRFYSLTDWVNSDSLMLVFQGDLQPQWFSSAIPGQGWLTIPLTTAFTYSGIDNLIVAIDENNPGYSSTGDDFYCTACPVPMSLEIHSLSTNPDPISPPPAYNNNPYNPLSVRANLKLDIQPVICTPHSPNPINNAVNVPLNTTLSWMSDADYWDVYFATANQPLILVAENLLEPTWTPANNLALLSSYQWQVISHTTNNDYTGNIWTFTTIGETLTAPQNLQAMSIQNTVHLAWDAPESGTIISYRIFRNNQLLDEVLQNEYTDTTVFWNQTYYYFILAINYLNQVSPPSNTETITMPGSMPIWQMDFEDQADFSTSIPNWTTYDLDNSPTWSFSNTNFPNEGNPLSWIVFNPSQTIPPINTVIPHSGQKMLLCIDSTNPPNNDWLISPQLSIQNGYQLSFWVRAWTGDYGWERLRVLISTSDTNVSSFQPLSTEPWLLIQDTWTRLDFLLSDYANQQVYLAWQCVSWDAFALALDNITITQSVSNEDNHLSVKDAIVLYPNPAREHFCVELESKSLFNLRIYNIKGQLVESCQNINAYQWHKSKSKDLKPGMYLLKLESNKHSTTSKIIVLE